MIRVNLKAKHYKDSNYCNTGNCGISNAVRDHFSKQDVTEGVRWVSVGDTVYRHKAYEVDDYVNHLEKAKERGWDDTIIGHITLEEVEYDKEAVGYTEK